MLKTAHLKQATMPESDRIPLRPEKTLTYTGTLTFAEYLAGSHHQDFLAVRQREIRLLPDDQFYFAAYAEAGYWLVVADDGPDTLVVLPVIARAAEQAPRITLRVVREEDAAAVLGVLIDDAPTLTALLEADLPLLVYFDEEWHFQEAWGPHPQAIEPYLDQWVADHPDFESLAEDESPAGHAAYAQLLDRLAHELRLWYNSNLNYACGQELHQLLARWHDESADEGEDEG